MLSYRSREPGRSHRPTREPPGKKSDGPGDRPDVHRRSESAYSDRKVQSVRFSLSSCFFH